MDFDTLQVIHDLLKEKRDAATEDCRIKSKKYFDSAMKYLPVGEERPHNADYEAYHEAQERVIKYGHALMQFRSVCWTVSTTEKERANV